MKRIKKSLKVLSAFLIVSALLFSSFSYTASLNSSHPNVTAVAKTESNAPIWPMFRYNQQHTGQCPYSTENNNGTLKWKFKTGSCIRSSPAIANDGTIYVGSEDDYLYAINPDGTLKWKFKTEYVVSASPAIASDGTIYVGSYDNYLYTIGSTKSIAFIYSNTDKASSYKSLLQSEGYSVDLILKGDVLNHNYDSYDLIIIGPETGYGYNWGDSNAESRISDSQKPVLGLGFGGASFFQDINLSINWGHGWVNSNDNSTNDDSIKVYVVDPLNRVFQQPYNISIPDDKIIQIYQNSGHIGEYAPDLPNNVVYYGREPTNDDHYTLVSEGKYFLWGFTNSPDHMTQVGKDLFINVVSYLISPSSFTLHIPSEWSIISVPFETDPSLLTTNANIQYLFYWDGNFWQIPTTLHPGIGYLVYNASSSEIDINLTGTPTSSPFTEPATGNWQVIGNPFTTTATLTSTSTITYLFYWDGTFWQLADPNNLQPGIGYLILTNSTGTLTFTKNP